MDKFKNHKFKNKYLTRFNLNQMITIKKFKN